MLEQAFLGIIQARQHDFRHAIMQQRIQGFRVPVGQRVLAEQGPQHPALQASHFIQSAIADDFRGLAGPGRNGAGTGHHHQLTGVGGVPQQIIRARRRIGQQLMQHVLFVLIEFLFQVHEMYVIRIKLLQQRHPLARGVQQLGGMGSGKGKATGMSHRVYRLVKNVLEIQPGPA